MPPSDKTYELSLSLKKFNPVKTALLKNFLINFNIPAEELVETRDYHGHRVSVYSNSLKKAHVIRRQLRESKLKGVSILLRSIKKQDWQSKWKKDFKPFRITRAIWIVPRWMKNRFNRKNKTVVYIDTALAFGTGLHATTQFLSRYIEEHKKNLDRFLDVGTGTGILAFIASQCGARSLRAIDLDPNCVKVAKGNAKVNKLHGIKFSVSDFNKFQIKQKFTFIAANLSTLDLVRFKQKLCRSLDPGGLLAVSGISLNNETMFRRAIRRLPLQCLAVDRKEGWVGFLFRKSR